MLRASPDAPSDAAREEAGRILRLVGGDPLRAYEMVERHLAAVALRAQVMLSLSGIVITVTGFSGKAVAETGTLARLSISAGILLVLLAAGVAFVGVLRLKWLTQWLGDDAETTLAQAIRLRDRKSRFLAASFALFVAGFALYVLAIVQLLVETRPH